jgi:hypothetical protein
LIAADVCMTPPDKSFSGDIDLVRVQQEPLKVPDPTFPPAAYVVLPRYRPERCHSMQLALVIGLFACGGLICSIFLVDGGDDFLRPPYWPPKSYSSPALAAPQRPVSAPAVPQNGTFKSNGEKKNAASQDHRVGDRKPLIVPLSLASAAQNSVLRR